MDPDKQAINAALAGNWKEAIKINLNILKADPKNLDALNRLGRAYLEIGLKTKSQKTYEKVMRLDKYNTIAAKSLELLKTIRLSHIGRTPSTQIAPPIFLEEPGVTKTVVLTRPGDPNVISRLHPGDPLTMAARDHCVSVTTDSAEYLGRLPDDLAMRLRSFLKSGNTYGAWVRSVELPETKGKSVHVKIFIKELSRAVQFKNTPSFPVTEKLSYAAFTPPELLHEDTPDTSTTEEDRLDTSGSDDNNEPDSDTPPVPFSSEEV